MTSAPSVEMTGSGLIWRDGTGRQIASLVAVSGVGEGVLVLQGDVPPETVLTPEHWRHFSEVAAYVARNAEIARAVAGEEPRVPRRAPADGALAPMG